MSRFALALIAFVLVALSLAAHEGFTQSKACHATRNPGLCQMTFDAGEGTAKALQAGAL